MGSLLVYPINAKLDFHAFMGPEGQQRHLFDQDYSSLFNFHDIFSKERFKKSETFAFG